MTIVLITALGVGGATVLGAVIGFLFKKASHRFSDIVLAFAAGVMLAAAVIGLILPSVEYGSDLGTLPALLMTVAESICNFLSDETLMCCAFKTDGKLTFALEIGLAVVQPVHLHPVRHVVQQSSGRFHPLIGAELFKENAAVIVLGIVARHQIGEIRLFL